MEGNFLITGAAQGFGKEFTRRVLKSKYLSFLAIIKITFPNTAAKNVHKT